MSLFICILIAISIADAISIDSNSIGWQFNGIGGLDAVGATRLLFEYPEEIRRQILNLLFTPNYGASYQILKSEINGDGDSSYGSGSSFMHTVNDNDPNRFNRGTRTWFMLEALKRNPNITLYALSWGVPHWVGNQSYYSQQGIDYHVQWLLGLKQKYNATYDYIGIWNEMAYEIPQTSNFVIGLRKALNANGLDNVQIVIPDGKASVAINETYYNSTIRDAISVIGQHGHTPFTYPPPQHMDILRNKYNIAYWNSENNIVDGEYPQYDKGIEWVRVNIQNYICCNSTIIIMCPFLHSWTMNYGRQNHGSSQFTTPWSGYYRLNAPFWSQSHITQFTRAYNGNWYYLNKPSTNHLFCSDPPNNNSCLIYYTVYTTKDFKDFSVIITNEANFAYNFTFNILNEFYSNLVHGNIKQLVHFRTLEAETEWFMKQKNIDLINNGKDMMTFTVSTESMSIHTISTITTAKKVTYPIPKHFQFPMPHISDFDGQTLGNPGWRLSDIFGAFDVAIDPVNNNNYVLKQAAPQNPYKNAWHNKLQPFPFTGFPSGTNWMNYNISANVLSMDTNNDNTVSICGLIPLWDPNHWTKNYSMGICLYLEYGKNRNWWISMNSASGITHIVNNYIANDTNKIGIVGNWNYLSLGFDDGTFQGLIGNNKHDIIYVSKRYNIADYVDKNNKNSTLYLTGIGGVGMNNWGISYYDNVSLELNHNHLPTPNGSYIMDAMVGSYISNNFTGYVGCILSLENATENLSITELGRFKIPGNNGLHQMNIIQVIDDGKYEFLMKDNITVDMSDCITDLNGFCYTKLTKSVDLHIGNIYLMVSYESIDGDHFVIVNNSATTSTINNRDGTTYISYLAPNIGKITGRVYFKDTNHVSIVQQTDTCYGPINWLIL